MDDFKPLERDRRHLAVCSSRVQDRYAYRENMTDVIVQHLISEQKVRPIALHTYSRNAHRT